MPAPAPALYPGARLFPGAPGPLRYPAPSLFPGARLFPGPLPVPPPAPAWPDAERAVCDLLAGLGTCGTEVRPSLQSQLPYLRVTRTGGGDDGVTDAATVSVDVFAAGASQAKAVAERARQVLAGPGPGTVPARQTDHGTVDRVTTVTGPARLPPTDSGNLRMVVASYRVSMRRQPAS